MDAEQIRMQGAGKRAAEPAALAAGGVATLLAGTCCLGPLEMHRGF